MSLAILDALAERRIRDAIERGELSDLPGTGRPLALDDDRLVPADVRMAHRILKNAGMVPPEVEALRDIAALERALHVALGDEHKRAAVQRLDCLMARLDRRPGCCALPAIGPYYDRLLERFAR